MAGGGKRGKPKPGFPSFPTALGNRSAIPTFPQPRRRFSPSQIKTKKPERSPSYSKSPNPRLQAHPSMRKCSARVRPFPGRQGAHMRAAKVCRVHKVTTNEPPLPRWRRGRYGDIPSVSEQAVSTGRPIQNTTRAQTECALRSIERVRPAGTCTPPRAAEGRQWRGRRLRRREAVGESLDVVGSVVVGVIGAGGGQGEAERRAPAGG